MFNNIINIKQKLSRILTTLDGIQLLRNLCLAIGQILERCLVLVGNYLILKNISSYGWLNHFLSSPLKISIQLWLNGIKNPILTTFIYNINLGRKLCYFKGNMNGYLI